MNCGAGGWAAQGTLWVSVEDGAAVSSESGGHSSEPEVEAGGDLIEAFAVVVVVGLEHGP